MDGVVGPLKEFFSKKDPASIDNFTFKLHYRATFLVLLSSMGLVSLRQYFGDPIDVRPQPPVPQFQPSLPPTAVYSGWSPRGNHEPLLLDPLHLLHTRVGIP